MEHRPIIGAAKTGSISQSAAQGAARFIKVFKLAADSSRKSKKLSQSKARELARITKALKSNGKLAELWTHGSKNSSRTFGFNFSPAMAQPKGSKQAMKTTASKARSKSSR